MDISWFCKFANFLSASDSKETHNFWMKVIYTQYMYNHKLLERYHSWICILFSVLGGMQFPPNMYKYMH